MRSIYFSKRKISQNVLYRCSAFIVYVLCVLNCYSQTISEKEVVVLFLKSGKRYKSLQIRETIDSLSKVQLETIRLPSLYINSPFNFAPFNFTPGDTAAVHDTASNRVENRQYFQSGLEFGLQQKYRGGKMNIGIETNVLNKYSNNLLTYDHLATIGIEHNLLRDGVLSDPLWTKKQENEIRLKIDSLYRNVTLRKELSTVRRLYWLTITSFGKMEIAKNELTRASELFTIEKNLLTLGKRIEVDTLSAAIQVISAKQEVLNSESVCSFLILELADMLGIDAGDLYINHIILDNVMDGNNTVKNVDTLIENEPKYLVLSHSLLLANIERKQTINSLFPYIKLGLNFKHSINANNYIEFDLVRNWTTVFLSIGYDFPIRSKKLELQKIKAKKDLYTADMQSYKDSVFIEIRKKSFDLNNKKALFNLSQQETKLTAKQFSIITELYKKGMRDQDALLNARETYLLSEKKKWNAFLAVKYALIDLDEMTGTVIDRFVM